MIRVLILTSLGAIISALSVSAFDVADYPHSLASLFRLNKQNAIETKKERALCESDECKFIAKVYKESMDDTVDPCDDFYEYACGNWAKNNPIPEGEEQWSLWKMVKNKVSDQVQELISKDQKPDDIFAVKMAKQWYKSCMDTDRMDKTGLDSLINSLWRHGGWPLIMEDGEWDDRVHTWQKVDDHFARLTGINALHSLRVLSYTWEDENEIAIFFLPPDVPTHIYAHWPINVNDDNNENEEISENEGDEDIEPDEDDEQDELQENTSMRRKLKTKVTHTKKEKNHKSRANKHGTMNKRVGILKRNSKDFEINTEGPTEGDSADDENDGEINDRNENPEEDKNEDGHDNEDMDDDNNPVGEKYERVFKDVVKFIALALAKARGVEISEEKFNKDVDNLWKLQKKLVVIIPRAEENNMTLGAFQEEYDSLEPTSGNGKVNWVNKIQKLFAQANTEVDDSLEVYVTNNYFSKLKSILAKTSSETVVNYVHWNFILHMLKATSKDLRNLYYGGKEHSSNYNSRSKECIGEAGISKIISYEYARIYFPDKIAQTAKDMIDDIQKEVEHQMKASTWMDDDTKEFVLDKLVHMKSLVGYPNWYRNNTIIKHYFRGLTVSPSYYENILSYMRFKKWRELRQLTETNDKHLDDLNPLMLNAFYDADENNIAITAADFQHPLFAFNRPWYINFAIIGLIMAHEVNHGFDNNGRHYDMTGTPMDWLPAMAKAYDKRSYCFVEQYNNYKLGQAKNITIEDYGNRTAGENIADTMGLHTVFRAYQRRERECQRPDPALPGLENFTNDQLFFLSVGNMWCQNANEAELVKRAKFDPHSIPRLRVIGPLSNSEDFAKAYNCPVGSPMNPEKKCNIWV